MSDPKLITLQISWEGATDQRKLEREIKTGLEALGNTNVRVLSNSPQHKQLDLVPVQAYARPEASRQRLLTEGNKQSIRLELA